MASREKIRTEAGNNSGRPQRRREAQRGGAERRCRERRCGGQDVAAWSGDWKSGPERSGAEPGRGLVILKSGVIRHGIRGPGGKAKLATRQACLVGRIVRRKAKCAPCSIFEMVCGRQSSRAKGRVVRKDRGGIRISQNNLRIGSEKANWRDHGGVFGTANRQAESEVRAL
jgi:hypothetical protein